MLSRQIKIDGHLVVKSAVLALHQPLWLERNLIKAREPHPLVFLQQLDQGRDGFAYRL
jgi:hypothetical protein